MSIVNLAVAIKWLIIDAEVSDSIPHGIYVFFFLLIEKNYFSLVPLMLIHFIKVN